MGHARPLRGDAVTRGDLIRIARVGLADVTAVDVRDPLRVQIWLRERRCTWWVHVHQALLRREGELPPRVAYAYRLEGPR